MAKLENKIIKKLETQKKVSHLSIKRVIEIWKHDYEKMTNYKRRYSKRTKASYELARNLIYNSHIAN